MTLGEVLNLWLLHLRLSLSGLWGELGSMPGRDEALSKSWLSSVGVWAGCFGWETEANWPSPALHSGQKGEPLDSLPGLLKSSEGKGLQKCEGS